jgi:RNA-directed DNA polymerase
VANDFFVSADFLGFGTECPSDFALGVNPLLRGWGEYYKRAHIRKLFQRLDGWVRRRIWSHRYKRWRNAGWKRLPKAQLHGEYELVRLLDLIPSLASRHS